MMVSLFPTITDTTHSTDLAIESVLTGIREGQWRPLVEAVRACTTKAEQREAKKHVPYFTASGTFATRRDSGLVQHSGLVCLDLDAADNAGTDLNATRALVQADSYTFACATSISGAGFFVLVRIPADDHAGSFRALSAYYRQAFGLVVDSLADVSRPRFVSYDPALYHNPDAVVFEESLPAPAPRAAGPVLASSFQPGRSGEGYGPAALRTAVGKVLSAVDGQKHYTLNKMAFLCGGYVGAGLLREDEAREQLRQAIGCREVTDAKNAWQTIDDGLKAGQLKPVLPEQLQYAVRKMKRDEQPAEAAVQRLVLTQGVAADAIAPAVAAIYQEEDRLFLTFWDVVYKEGRTKSQDTTTLLLNRAKYVNWLAAEGFAIHKQGTGRIVPVHIAENVVTEVTRVEIKKHVADYVASLPFEFDGIFRILLEDRIQKEHRQLFEDGTLEFLPTVGDSFVRDTKRQAYFYFANCWVEVTAAGIVARPYDELPGRIWASQRVARDFTPYNLLRKLPDLDLATFGVFGRYLQLITASNAERLDSLASALGYLLHRHKSRTECYAVILCDEAITRGGAAGRTGKGLLVQGLEKLRTIVKHDGKNFDITRQFAFQRVRHDTDLIVLDDLDARKLPFEQLFSIITTGMEVEVKGGQQQYIDFHDAPKLLINTNDTLVGEGASHEGRKVEIEVASYFSATHTPCDEFGHELFDEWAAEEWMLFDNLLLRCAQRYLAHGVRKAAPINLNRRKLIQKTCEEFAAFMDAEVKVGQWHPRRLLWTQFREECGFDEKMCSLRRFNGWLKDYGHYMGYVIDEARQTTGFLPGGRDLEIKFNISNG
ncbi:MAG: BT4734/BF3469 family protein [Janthinobacterium lividum]